MTKHIVSLSSLNTFVSQWFGFLSFLITLAVTRGAMVWWLERVLLVQKGQVHSQLFANVLFLFSGIRWEGKLRTYQSKIV